MFDELSEWLNTKINHREGRLFMFDELSEWLDTVLEAEISDDDDVTAFGFNLCDDGDCCWSMELVGASDISVGDTWRLDDMPDFDTRENLFRWKKEAEWEEILADVINALKEYLQNGKYADTLKSRVGVGVEYNFHWLE